MKFKKPLQEFTMKELRKSLGYAHKLVRNCRNLINAIDNCSNETIEYLDKSINFTIGANPEYTKFAKESNFTGHVRELTLKNLEYFEEIFSDLKQELKRRDVMKNFTQNNPE